MDADVFNSLFGLEDLGLMAMKHGELFLAMVSSLPLPLDPETFVAKSILAGPAPSGRFPAKAGDDPAAEDAGAAGGGDGAEEARELSRRARECAIGKSMAYDLSIQVASRLSAAARRGDGESLRLLLGAVADISLSGGWADFTAISYALDSVPDGPGHSEELACALACFAARSIANGDAADEADRILRRAVELEGFAGMADPSLPFLALSLRAGFSGTPPYGPGASSGGALANALALVPRLPSPELAEALPAFALDMASECLFSLSEMEEGEARGLPGSGTFMLAWEAAKLSCAFQDDPRGAAGAALDCFARLAGSGGLSPMADPFSPTAMLAANAFGSFFKHLDGEGALKAVKAAAPPRSKGDLGPWAFYLLFNRLPQEVFQAAVMRAAADGLFGDSIALVHAVCLAGIIHGGGSRSLASFADEAEAIRRMAGTPESPGPLGARVAAGFIAFDLAGRAREGQEAAFAALAALLPEGGREEAPGGGREEAGGSSGRGGERGAEAALMCHFACASALVVASRALAASRWEKANAAPDAGGEEAPGSGKQYPSRLERETDKDVMRRLVSLVPDRALDDNAFSSWFLPNAALLAMDPRAECWDDGVLAGALAGRLGSRESLTVEASTLDVASAWVTLAVYPSENQDAFRAVLAEAKRALAGPVPHEIRSLLVEAVLAGFLEENLPAEMEEFFLDNALMLVGYLSQGEPSAIDGPSVGMFPGPKNRVQVSWPATPDLFREYLDARSGAADGAEAPGPEAAYGAHGRSGGAPGEAASQPQAEPPVSGRAGEGAVQDGPPAPEGGPPAPAELGSLPDTEQVRAALNMLEVADAVEEAEAAEEDYEYGEFGEGGLGGAEYEDGGGAEYEDGEDAEYEDGEDAEYEDGEDAEYEDAEDGEDAEYEDAEDGEDAEDAEDESAEYEDEEDGDAEHGDGGGEGVLPPRGDQLQLSGPGEGAPDEGDAEPAPPSRTEELRAAGEAIIQSQLLIAAFNRERAASKHEGGGFGGWLARYCMERRGAPPAAGPRPGGETPETRRAPDAQGAPGPRGAPDAGVPSGAHGDGPAAMTIAEARPSVYGTYALCLATNGRYELALDLLLRDPSPGLKPDVKALALLKTVSGMAKLARPGRALPALRLLEKFEGSGVDADSLTRARTLLYAALRRPKKKKSGGAKQAGKRRGGKAGAGKGKGGKGGGGKRR
ncbi:MAG: hypothetical protein LBQ12_11885 [Deltaproteobacteria bacterium]|jgi:hypothetical protein|nr:hypothetical protein [Deltaproteobacteria bacterium]